MVDDRVKRIAELIEPLRVKPGSKVTLAKDFDPGYKASFVRKRDGVTTLTGRVADQAQLLGLVERAQELGFELLSLQQLSGADDTSPPTEIPGCACGTAEPIANVTKGITSWSTTGSSGSPN